MNNTAIQTINNSELNTRWQEFKERNPKTRIRDAAIALGVSEAELLATNGGETVTRLDVDFGKFLTELDALGRVMALTRNDEIVHERKGRYSRVELFPEHNNMGQVLDEGIDLRLFLSHWHLAFAVQEESPHGTRRSFQFFDARGTAVHKVFLLDDSNIEAFDEFISRYKTQDQPQTLTVTPKPEPTKEKPDDEIDVEGFRDGWSKMTDTHEFFQLTRKFGVSREQALRLASNEMARKVSRESYKKVLEESAKNESRIMVFVGNAGVIQIHSGRVKNIKTVGNWFNVLDPDFNLHINEDRIANAYVVRKPTSDGFVTSLELFNERGDNIALFFSKRKPGEVENDNWRELLASC